jgi:hypothetical protein
MEGLLHEAEMDPVFVAASRMDGIPGHGVPFRAGCAVRFSAVSALCEDLYNKGWIISMGELKWF